MASSQDTEITLGTGKLLVLFFGLVGVCALFFALGYALGRKSEPAITTANAAGQPIAATGKASGNAQTPEPSTPMTFYKSVEQKDVNPQLTPPADNKPETPAAPAESSTGQTSPDSSATLPGSGYFVQVAAVSREEDAQALVEALKKKDYPAFVAPAGDKLFRVQVGPYNEIKDAEAMRTRLIAEGYSPIVKK